MAKITKEYLSDLWYHREDYILIHGVICDKQKIEYLLDVLDSLYKHEHECIRDGLFLSMINDCYEKGIDSVSCAEKIVKTNKAIADVM